MTSYPVWLGDRWEEIPMPPHSDRPVVVPIVSAVLWRSPERAELLLQRRDKEGEPVLGLLELPGGRWHAGETAEQAVRREVLEETGLEAVVALDGQFVVEPQPGRPFASATPLLVTVGVGGAFPAMLVAFECFADGDPRPQPGETSDPAFRTVAEVRELLAEPAQFTGPAFAVLTFLFG